MDLLSYKLGKKNGGATPNYQTKNVTITENKTTNITPDTGYDGLLQVNVTTNIASETNFVDTKLTNVPAYKYIKKIPLIDTSNKTEFYDFCSGLTNLEEIAQIDTSKSSAFNSMFSGCTNLKNVPVFNATNAQTMGAMFLNCGQLTTQSLDNILQTCISTTNKFTQTKSLYTLGLRSDNYSTATIEALPHYQDFLNAGWTIGY